MEYQNPYIVQSGDSLWKIAHNFGYSVDYLYNHPWNDDLKQLRTDPGSIQPGDKVFLPPKPIIRTREKNLKVAPVIDTTTETDAVYNTIRLNVGVRFLFLYADIPGDLFQNLEDGDYSNLDYVVSGRSLFYWLYDTAGDKLDTATDWQGMGKILPQGIGYIINGFMVQTGPYKQTFEGLELEVGATEGTFRSGEQPFVFGQANVLDTAGYFSSGDNGEILYNKYAISQFYQMDDTSTGQNYIEYSGLGTPYIKNYQDEEYFSKNPFLIYNPWKNSPVGDNYNRYPVDISPTSQNGNPYATSGCYVQSTTIEDFMPERKYGFFLFPSDMGGYLSKPFLDLAQVNATDIDGAQIPEQFIATEVDTQPITDGTLQLVKLHCTLPEWDFRLSRQTSRLEAVINEYMMEVEEDQKALALLRDIKDFASINLKFPFEQQESANIDKKIDLINKLTEMEDGITTNFIDPDNPNKRAAELLVQKESEATALWEMLQSEALRAELNAYETADGGELNPNLGPYTHHEPNWGRIYMTIAKAYRILSYTSYGQTVYDKMIEPVLEQVGATADAIEIPQADSDEIENLILNEKKDEAIKEEWAEIKAELNKQETVEPDESNLFLSGIYSYTTFITNTAGLTITNAPGPPSLFLELLDVYGVFAFKSLQGRSKRVIKMSRAFKALVFLMEKTEGRKMSKTQIKDLLKCIYGSKRSLKRGFDVFYRFKNGAADTQTKVATDKIFNNPNQSKQFKAAGAAYKGVMAALGVFNSVVSTIHMVEKWDSMTDMERLKGVADQGISYAGTTMSVILLIGKFRSGAVVAATAKFATKFNVYINFYFAAMSAIECGMAISNGDVGGAIMAGLNAGASLMIPIGYMLVAAGLVPGIGHALLIVGLAIQLGLLFWPHIKQAFHRLAHTAGYLQIEEKINTFESFEIEGVNVMERYAVLESIWSNIQSLWKTIDWQRLSWRAIVPLYLEGYDIPTIETMVCIGVQSDTRDLDFWEKAGLYFQIGMANTVDDINRVMEPYTWNVDEILGHYLYLAGNDAETLPEREEENGHYANLMTMGIYAPEEFPELNPDFPNDLYQGFQQEEATQGKPRDLQTSCILSITVKNPSKSPFKEFQLSEPVTIQYHLDYEGTQSQEMDVIPADNAFLFSPNQPHEISLTQQESEGLKGIYFWSKEHGEAAFLGPDADAATGRLYSPKKEIETNNDELKLLCEFEIIKGVLPYIIEEQKKNLNNEDFKKIIELNNKVKQTKNKKDANDYEEKALGLWFYLVHKNEGLAGALQDLGGIYYAKKFGGGEWDYKTKIRPIWGSWQRYGNTKDVYYYDVWANLHYGYMGKLAGFSKKILIDYANRAQGIDGADYDPSDDIMTQEGYDMAEFSKVTILNTYQKNREYWIKNGRNLLWENEEEREKYMNLEFPKRNIPFPKTIRQKIKAIFEAF